jgi:hypothetical protein
VKAPVSIDYANAKGQLPENATPEHSVVIGLAKTGILMARPVEKLTIVDVTGDYELVEGSAAESRCVLSVRHEPERSEYLRSKLACTGSRSDLFRDQSDRGWVFPKTGRLVIVENGAWYWLKSDDYGLIPEAAPVSCTGWR